MFQKFVPIVNWNEFLKHPVLYSPVVFDTHGNKEVIFFLLESTPDNSNLLGKSKKFRVIGSLKQITGNKDGRECN